MIKAGIFGAGIYGRRGMVYFWNPEVEIAGSPQERGEIGKTTHTLRMDVNMLIG
jgi:hypothetical protein